MRMKMVTRTAVVDSFLIRRRELEILSSSF